METCVPKALLEPMESTSLITSQNILPFTYLFINKCPAIQQKRTKAVERNLNDVHGANTPNVRTARYIGLITSGTGGFQQNSDDGDKY